MVYKPWLSSLEKKMFSEVSTRQRPKTHAIRCNRRSLQRSCYCQPSKRQYCCHFQNSRAILESGYTCTTLWKILQKSIFFIRTRTALQKKNIIATMISDWFLHSSFLPEYKWMSIDHGKLYGRWCPITPKRDSIHPKPPNLGW